MTPYSDLVIPNGFDWLTLRALPVKPPEHFGLPVHHALSLAYPTKLVLLPVTYGFLDPVYTLLSLRPRSFKQGAWMLATGYMIAVLLRRASAGQYKAEDWLSGAERAHTPLVYRCSQHVYRHLLDRILGQPDFSGEDDTASTRRARWVVPPVDITDSRCGMDFTVKRFGLGKNTRYEISYGKRSALLKGVPSQARARLTAEIREFDAADHLPPFHRAKYDALAKELGVYAQVEALKF